jgi:hypothetical protein
VPLPRTSRPPIRCRSCVSVTVGLTIGCLPVNGVEHVPGPGAAGRPRLKPVPSGTPKTPSAGLDASEGAGLLAGPRRTRIGSEPRSVRSYASGKDD